MNKVILAVLLAGVGAQIVKLISIYIREKELEWHDLFLTGGMPSTHSAFVVSLATILYLNEGLSSVFIISLVLAIIVLRDASGVRRTVGEEGMIITQMMKKLKMKKETHFSMGHTPLQVLVGSLIGFIVAFGVYCLI
jgi:uncharacterized protein